SRSCWPRNVSRTAQFAGAGFLRKGGRPDMKTAVRMGMSLLLLAGLAGCASMNSVHWVYPGPGKSRVFSTDAFQRHLIMVEDPADRNKIRACSEASPDAMAVFSASLTGRGIF